MILRSHLISCKRTTILRIQFFLVSLSILQKPQKMLDQKHVSCYHVSFCLQKINNTHLLFTVKNCYELWKDQNIIEELENVKYESAFSSLYITEPGESVYYEIFAYCIS